MTKEQINNIAAESAKLIRDNPDWPYKRAIAVARKLILKD